MSTNSSVKICPSCGASVPEEAKFCSQCGTSLAVSQTEPKIDPEKLWRDGYESSKEAFQAEMQGNFNDAERLNQRAVQLFKEALDNGLEGRNEITCRWLLGNALYDENIRTEYENIHSKGLKNIPHLERGVKELEKAVMLDSRQENSVFSNRQPQSDLLRLDTIWAAQSGFIKERNGTKSAISYLKEKMKIIQHLGIFLPNAHYSLATYYLEENNVAEAKNMFRVVMNAEDYGDVLDSEERHFCVAQITKGNAAKNLKYLETHGQPPSKKSASGPDPYELYEQSLQAEDRQDYGKVIELLNTCLCMKPDPVLSMVGYFNIAVAIHSKHNFGNRRGESIPDDEFRWCCRMTLCAAKSIKIYETQLANRLTGDKLAEVTGIYQQAKKFYNYSVMYGMTHRDRYGKAEFRNLNKVYNSYAPPLACIEGEERQEAAKY